MEEDEKPTYEDLLAQLETYRAADDAAAVDDEARSRAKIGAMIEGFGAGAGKASDTLFQGYTGEKVQSPSAGYQGNAIKQYLADKADKRRASKEDADRKFKLAQYMQQQGRMDAGDERQASQFDQTMQYKRDALASQAADRKTARAGADQLKQMKVDEINRELEVPGLGTAMTKDDAKKLKGSVEMKKKFDRQINELIDLRDKYGVEYVDRNAVARGKQLSKDLLLTYKNLAKLGVLSKADEAIVDAIIPGDPLGQDFAPGQDPILHKLKKFRGDLDEDYKNTIALRLQGGGDVVAGMEADKEAAVAGGDRKLLSDSAIAGEDGPNPDGPDAKVSAYARANGLGYEKAKHILVKRGYQPNE